MSSDVSKRKRKERIDYPLFIKFVELHLRLDLARILALR